MRYLSVLILCYLAMYSNLALSGFKMNLSAETMAKADGHEVLSTLGENETAMISTFGKMCSTSSGLFLKGSYLLLNKEDINEYDNFYKLQMLANKQLELSVVNGTGKALAVDDLRDFMNFIFLFSMKYVPDCQKANDYINSFLDQSELYQVKSINGYTSLSSFLKSTGLYDLKD